MKVNLELSKEIAQYIHPQPKRCFNNSALTAVYLGKGAVYCEGLAASVRFSFPLEHAWVVWNNEIIDVSWLDEQTAYYTIKYTVLTEDLPDNIPFNASWRLDLDEWKQIRDWLFNECEKMK